VSGDSHFADPIELPSGRKLITLRDAALYITKLPKAEHDADEWQAVNKHRSGTPTQMTAMP